MHAHGEARLLRGAEVDLNRNPVERFSFGRLGDGQRMAFGRAPDTALSVADD
jgi:hypothetical protein